MPLPEPQARQHLHTRTVVYRGYLREDGLWDIEGEMTDTKALPWERSMRPVLPPGAPVHGLSIRATVDDAMTIHEIVSSTDHIPFDECEKANEPFKGMVGVTIGPGWRGAIERAMGGIRGCTHLRELLFNMATAAFQTIPPHQRRVRKQAGQPDPHPDKPPYHLGKCMSWDFDGPVVARHVPEFAGWKPLKRRT